MSNETHPFLPEPDPPTPSPKSRSSWMLLLWVLLIVMFLAIWQFLSPAPSATQVSAPLPPCENTAWTSSGVLLSPFLFALLVGCVWWRLIRYRGVAGRFNISQEPGLLALAERRFSDAAEVFRATAASQSSRTFYQGVAVYNLAYTQVWSGQLDDAIRSLARVEKVIGAVRASGIRMRAACDLVLVHALTGDLDTAERWADDTRARIAKSRESRLYFAAQLCLGESVIALRRGRPGDARASLEKNWLKLRDTLTANHMRLAEVVRAFAEADGTVRDYNTVAERLIRVEPVSVNEFAFVGVQWPEMRAFLAAHRLTTEGSLPNPVAAPA